MKSNNEMNLCSVLMITYNHEKYIAQAIDSVLMQKTNFDFEIVIGEDCSTDRTREIVLEYKAKHPDKIKLLLQEKNVGMMPNFIDTLKACTGKYIALLEGDDYWTDPYKLQKQVDILETHPEYVLAFHEIYVLNNQGKKSLHCNNLRKLVFDFNDLLKGNFIPTCSVMFRNNLINDFPPYFKYLPIGDYPLYLLLSKFGKFYFLNYNMAVYRIHLTGYFSQKNRINQLEDILQVLNNFCEYFSEYKYEIKKRIIKQRYALSLQYALDNNKPKSILNFKQIFIYFPQILFSIYYFKSIIKILPLIIISTKS